MSEDKMSDIENYLRDNARIIDRKLTQFSESAQLLSNETPRMIDQYENQWVGVYHGHVAASGATLEAVAAEIEKKGIPAGETIVRHIDRESRTFIF